MKYFGVLAAVFGIVLGISLTFQIERLLYRSADNDNVTSNRKMVNDSDISFKSSSNSRNSAVNEIRLARLREEKSRLQARLKAIDLELTKSETKLLVEVATSETPPVAVKKKQPIKHSKSCPYNFKVYVYDIPHSLPSVHIGEEARRNGTLHVCQKCILEQFALEYIIQDFFTGFCGRTYNPEEADFFYLPIIRDAEFRVAMSQGGRNRAPSATEQALLQIIEHNDSTMWNNVFRTTDKYWYRYGGGDHIIVMPAPVTNLRHESSQRGFFHYMMHLHTPIFLCLEYSVDFIKEYPVCSSHKNIMVPYPTTDPDLFNGKLIASHISRSYLLYYAGGMHGDCIQVRKAMKMLMANSTRLPGVVPPIKSNQAEREHGFLAATFCPVPVGDSPSSKRMYDVLNFGCIPVVLSDDLAWAYSQFSGGPINHTDYSITIPQSVVHYTAQRTLRKYFTERERLGILPSGSLVYDLLEQSVTAGGDYYNGNYVNPLVQILQRVPKSDKDYLISNVAKIAPHFRYYQMNSSMINIPTKSHTFPNGGAIDIMADLLQQRKDYGLDKLRSECQSERFRSNHKYISRYECETTKQESLVRRHRRKLRNANRMIV